MSNKQQIRRGFVDLDFGQMHYRQAGDGGRPLVMLHASPGSSRQLEPLIATMATARPVIAPDTPGFGDSIPAPETEPTIADYAAHMISGLDALGIDSFDLYGSHTGACVATEVAILAPGRVRRLLLDGVGSYSGTFQQSLLDNYAPPFEPTLDGSYLISAFHFLRDQSLFWPWFDKSRGARRDAGLLSADRLHAWVLELLKAPTTYLLGYRAAFSWPRKERLKLVSCPTLIFSSADDPLAEDTAALAPLLRDGHYMLLPRGDDPDFVSTRARTLREFLDAEK